MVINVENRKIYHVDSYLPDNAVDERRETIRSMVSYLLKGLVNNAAPC